MFHVLQGSLDSSLLGRVCCEGGYTVGTTVASPVLMDKAVAMNGGHRFVCSSPPDNQTWQAGTLPFSDRRYIFKKKYFSIDMLVFGGVFMISTGARCLSINSKVRIALYFFVHCHKGAIHTSIPPSTLSTATA